MQIWNQFNKSGLGPRTREISARDRERLFFLMHQMLRCGQTTESSVRTVAKAFRDEKKEEIGSGLISIAQKVAQGKRLSAAMESEYVMFNDVHRAAIIAGEAANNMVEAFHTLQKLEKKKMETSRAGMAEIITPSALFVLSLFSLFNTGLNTLPVMKQMQESQGKELGIIPSTIIALTEWCADNWYILFTALVLGLIVFYSLIKSTQGRFMLDAYTLKVPGLGKYIRYKTYSSMLLYFPHLIASGVKPKQMIPIMEALATNAILKRNIDAFNQTITTGGQMSKAMEKAGFPSICVTPVRVSENYAGSERGVNDVMIEGMNHAYSILERELSDAHKSFIVITSTFMWLLGGSVMMLEMLSIVMSQN